MVMTVDNQHRPVDSMDDVLRVLSERARRLLRGTRNTAEVFRSPRLCGFVGLRVWINTEAFDWVVHRWGSEQRERG